MSCLVKAPDYMLILAKVGCLTDLVPVMTPFSFCNYLILSDAPILQQVSTHCFLAHAMLAPALLQLTPAPCEHITDCSLSKALDLCTGIIVHASCSHGQLSQAP